MMQFNSQEKQALHQAVQNLIGSDGTMSPRNLQQTHRLFVYVNEKWAEWLAHTNNILTVSHKMLVKVSAVHMHAVKGEYPDEMDASFLNSLCSREVAQEWELLRGTKTDTAQRRFIGLLRNINPKLLEVSSSYTFQPPPKEFPTNLGIFVCPYSNSKAGCPLPLMDKDGRNVEQELQYNHSFSDIEILKEWLDNVLKHQRCRFGRHCPCPPGTDRLFCHLFSRPEYGGGFSEFRPSFVYNLLRDVLEKQILTLYEMQQEYENKQFHKDESLERKLFIRQQNQFDSLRTYYATVTGYEFKSEIPCQRDALHCNTRRFTEGKNHSHAIQLRKLPRDPSKYFITVDLRECQRLGISPVTGVVKSIKEREDILREKICKYHRDKAVREHVRWKATHIRNGRIRLTEYGKVWGDFQIVKASVSGDLMKVARLISGGGHNPQAECKATGIFPLMASVIKGDTIALEKLLDLQCDPNYCNVHGVTSLMCAIRKNNATAGFEGKNSGMTAMHVAAQYGRDEMIELVANWVLKNTNGDEKALQRVLSARAEPGKKDFNGNTASDIAQNRKQTEVSIWLRHTRAFGSKGVYTYNDTKKEKALKEGRAEMERALEEGSSIIQHRGIKEEAENYSLIPQMSTIEELLKKNLATPDTETEEGQTPLLLACYQGSPRDVQTLLNLGCCPGHANQNGCTPLMAAAASQSHEKVLALMSTGDCCIPEARDIEGKRAANYVNTCNLVAKSFTKCADDDSAGLIQLLSLAAAKGCNVALCWRNKNHSQKGLENSMNFMEKISESGKEYIMVKHSTNVRKNSALMTTKQQQPNRRSRGTAPVVVACCCVCTLPMPCEAHSKVNKNEIVAHYTTEEADASQPQSEKNVVVNGQLDSFSFDELYKHHSFKKTQYKAARKTITSLHLNHH